MDVGRKLFLMFRPIVENPDRTQTRILADFCGNPEFIPDLLMSEGLTLEVLVSIIDEYLTHRIEPEELMHTHMERKWNSWGNSLFSMHCTGFRFINGLDNDPEGEFITVYDVHPSDEICEGDTELSNFFDNWFISIKEKSWFDDFDYGRSPVFWFVIEIRSCAPKSNSSLNMDGIKWLYGEIDDNSRLAISFDEGEWCLISIRNDDGGPSAHFHIHHKGY